MIVVDFETSSMEMQAVADKFDRDGDGFIDYKEFIAALRPDRQEVALLALSVTSLRPDRGEVALLTLLGGCSGGALDS